MSEKIVNRKCELCGDMFQEIAQSENKTCDFCKCYGVDRSNLKFDLDGELIKKG